MFKEIFAFALFLIATLASQTLLANEDRHIHLNGEHLEAADIQVMDQLWGQAVPDGFYWLNPQTGEWGLEASGETLGVVTSIAQYAAHLDAQSTAQSNGSTTGNAYINSSQNGSVVSGNIGGQHCTYASAGGYTVRSCE